MNDEEEIPKVWNWKELLTEKELGLIDKAPVHWEKAKPSLPLRLIGVFAVGPDADIKTEKDTPEFGWRRMYVTPPTPVMFEASVRILELEAELQAYREKFFRQECDLRGIPKSEKLRYDLPDSFD